MKINLAAKNDHVKDNYPAGNFDTGFKRKENKTQQQKKCINYNGAITQYYKSTFKPGKRQNQVCISIYFIAHFNIPQYNGYQKTGVAKNSNF